MSEQYSVDQQEEILEDVIPEFLVEADDLLESLNEHLLQLDEGVKAQVDQAAPACDKELLNEVFRSAHTLKGLSGMFGFTQINQLTHKVENIFDAARSDQLPVTSDIVDVIFRAIDHVSAMVEGLRNGELDGVDAEAIQTEIQSVLQATGTEKSLASEVDLEAALAEAAAQRAAESETNTASEASPEASNEESSVEQDEEDLEAQLAKAFAERDAKQAETALGDATDNQSPETTASSAESEIPATDNAGDHPFDGVEDDENIPANYLSIFIDETESSLDSLTEVLLDGVDQKVAEQLLVICHRIKGSAASIGLNRAAELGHVMEDLLQDLEEAQEKPTVEVADALLCAVDALRNYVGALREGSAKDCDFKPAYDRLMASRSQQLDCAATADLAAESSPAEPTFEAAGTSTAPTDSREEEHTEDRAAAPPKTPLQFNPETLAKIVSAAPVGSPALAVKVAFRADLMLVGMKARLLFEKLSKIGDVFYCDPAEDELDDAEEISYLMMGVSTDVLNDEIRDALSVEGVEEIIFEMVAESLSATANEAVAPSQTEPAAEEPTPMAQEPIAAQAAADLASVATPPANNTTDTKPAAKKPRTATPSPESAKPVETVRVDIDRLDQLMNMAGQLVINKARFSQISASMKRSVGTKSNTSTINELMRSMKQLRHGLDGSGENHSFDENLDSMQSCVRRVFSSMEVLQSQLEQVDVMRQSVNDLLEAVHQLDRVADGIQKGVMDTRMVPVGPLFGRFKRVIRDISHSTGKKIRLEIRGENTELDKRMIDELGDPLIHIVRNSADHGIESPEDRVAKGKPAEGVVTLDAAHRGNSIVIEVVDDGKGLDTDRIRNKAIEKGVISAAEAEKLTDHQVHQLIWEPGLSTAEQITNVSGRGMGMDIVRSKIEEINGVVEMHSTAGEGTRITIKLPLTLAILPSLLAEIEGDVFALPVESVSEIVSLTQKDLTTVHGMPTAMVRGQAISVVSLPSLFHWSHPPKQKSDTTADDETILVIVESDGQLLGLVVDSLLGEEDIVIKSLAENYENVQGIAGASILGDGRVSLILDTNALLAAASGRSEIKEVVENK